MTMSSPTDAAFGLCHVVAKYPLLGVAFCALGLGGMNLPEGTIPFSAASFGADSSIECGVNAEYVVPIDLEQMDEHVYVGECLDDYVPLSVAELQQRCEALPPDDKLCIQLRRE